MKVLQHKRNELNLCLKQNQPDRSYRDTLLIRVVALNIQEAIPRLQGEWLIQISVFIIIAR